MNKCFYQGKNAKYLAKKAIRMLGAKTVHQGYYQPKHLETLCQLCYIYGMSINLFVCNTSKASASLAIENLGKRLGEIDNAIVIVPEHHSLDTEKQIYQTLKLEGSDNIDVVSFARLAYKLTKDCAEKVLTREGCAILLNKTINEIVAKDKEALHHFKAVAGNPRFVAEMLVAIDSLKKSGISPEQLKEAGGGIAQTNKFKLLDIAHIYKAYLDKLQGQFFDVHTRLEALADAIPNSELIKKSDIYVIGHNFFDSQQKIIIDSLIKYAKSFNIALCQPSHNKYVENQDGTKNAIISFARKAGKKYEIIKGSGIFKETIGLLCSGLYSYKGLSTSDRQDSLDVFYELNPYEEVKAVGKEVARLIREKGYRYKDIAIISPDDSYKTIIRDIFTRYDIPIYIDIKYPAKRDIFSVFLENVLEAAYSPQQKNMFALAKHPFLQTNGALFEDYCIKYNINFSYFEQEFIIGHDKDKEDCEEIRKSVLAILAPLKKAKPTYTDIGLAVVQLVDRFIPSHSAFLENGSLDAVSVSASEQMPEKIKNIIIESSNILQDMPCSLEQFAVMLSTALEQNSISVIPQYIDAIFAGGLQESSYNQVKVLFFVGANQGTYPATPQAQDILNIYDMAALEKVGISFYPLPTKIMERERFIILDTLAKAEDKLYISCSAYNLAGGVLKKGDLYKEGVGLNGGKEQSIYYSFAEKATLSAKDFYNFAVNSRNLFYEYASLLSQDAQDSAVRKIENYLCNKGWGDLLTKIRIKEPPITDSLDYFFKKSNGCYNTSVSQLERYFTCPYMHYFAYGLRLKEREGMQLATKDIGSILHDVLELYFNNVKDKVHSISDAEISEESLKAIEQVFDNPIIDAQKNSLLGTFLYDAIKHECKQALFGLTKSLQKGCYTPKYLELKFGVTEGYDGIEIQVGEDKFLVTGKIDRIDTQDKNLIIIDYKSSTSVGENCKYANIYNGTKIQLFMYLQAFLKENYIPRGVFYLPLGLSYSKSSKGLDYLLQGFIDESEDAFYKLDNEAYAQAIEERVQSSVVDFKVTRQKDDFKITTNKKRVLSQENFSCITKYVLDVSRKALAEIIQGYMARRPYQRACEWCSYACICKGEREERNEHKVDDKEFFNL